LLPPNVFLILDSALPSGSEGSSLSFRSRDWPAALVNSPSLWSPGPQSNTDSFCVALADCVPSGELQCSFRSDLQGLYLTRSHLVEPDAEKSAMRC
jgi:hypothetical protein